VKDRRTYVKDSGVSPKDSEVFPEDSEVFPEDSGVSPEDSGVFPEDSGVSPKDAGVFWRTLLVLGESYLQSAAIRAKLSVNPVIGGLFGCAGNLNSPVLKCNSIQ
jgi:hypothetical protein